MAEIAEVFAKVFRPISKSLDDIEGLGECQYTREAQQNLLSNAVTGL